MACGEGQPCHTTTTTTTSTTTTTNNAFDIYSAFFGALRLCFTVRHKANARYMKKMSEEKRKHEKGREGREGTRLTVELNACLGGF